MEQGNFFKYSVPFTMVANELIMCEYMSPILKTVYSLACCYASLDDSSCYPSYTTIAKKAGISRRTAIRAIKTLQEAGLLTKETRKSEKQEYTSNIYTVNQWSTESELYFKQLSGKDEPAWNDNKEGGVTDTLPPSVTNTPGGVTDTPPPSVTNTPGSVTDTPPFLYEQESLNNNQFFNNNQSINQKAEFNFQKEPSDEEQVLSDQIELEAVIQNCELEIFQPEVGEMFRSAIERIFYSKNMKIGNAILPKERLRSYLRFLSGEVLTGVLETMRHNTQKVKNPNAWLMSTIINTICEAQSELILGLPASFQDDQDLYASG